MCGKSHKTLVSPLYISKQAPLSLVYNSTSTRVGCLFTDKHSGACRYVYISRTLAYKVVNVD